jgi:hypothetical protein
MINRNTIRAELAGGRAEYRDLRDAELTALLWAGTSEYQRRFGDRRTVDALAFLAQRLPDMAREQDR